MSVPRQAPLAPWGTQAAALLASPAFVLALVLLVTNDWILKPAFGNGLTGKLSDVAGLFAWALFWCALAPRRHLAVFCLTTVAWLVWKSPLSEAPLAAWNALGAWPLARVVDVTDGLALAVLVPAWHVVARAERVAGREPGCGAAGAWRRAGALGSAVFAIVAFSATSRPMPSATFPDAPSWTVAAPRDSVRDGIARLGFELFAARRYGQPVDTTLAGVPVVFRIGQTVKGDGVFVDAWLERVATDTTRITLLRAYSYGYGSRAQPAAVQQLFVETVVEPLRARFGPAGPVER
jgi:hypothetical protein